MGARSGSVLVVGVGGQGVVLSSAVAADAARRCGFDVKQSEVHGMSQRGGVVTSHLRYGDAVHSPLIAAGEADAIVALEWNEALRALPALRPGGTLIVSVERILPPSAFLDRLHGALRYPPIAVDLLRGTVPDVRACDATAVAARAGDRRAMNTVLLGVLSRVMPFSETAWDDAIVANVPPKALGANRAAFAAGRALQADDARRALARLARSDEGGDARRAAASLEIVDAWCKGEMCGICVRSCPEYCLGFDAEATAVRVTRADACTACGLCELLCPDFAIVVHPAVPA
ncbi:MAG: 2-oxoacid:acceptor oxidoreductase family protein [Chloroflexota bacterium]|nr:2-oxoacid:acceptor oxidoreductase family protein [Chloroflexota bacterium]